ncbi:uncharacterized protein LOC101453319 [Ceratitis capitata]|uniref:uncharacterized protein LOC101453319 n=1 Tax=Ceratitis capitata TaxID=7213 RepID=UPI0006189228|nr:uncharacterized protein LOC101453319 [Ceratitis capitata]
MFADENRDVNMPSEDEIKRQRIAYSGDQIYSNIWSGKWCIKDEHKLLSELGSLTTNSNTAYYDTHSNFPATGVTGSDAIIYDSINSISQTQNSLYTPSIGASIGSSSLTPLVPINMSDMKLNTSGHEGNISPYYTDSGHYATLTHVDNSDGFMKSESSLVGAPSARGIGLPSGLRPIAILSESSKVVSSNNQHQNRLINVIEINESNDVNGYVSKSPDSQVDPNRQSSQQHYSQNIHQQTLQLSTNSSTITLLQSNGVRADACNSNMIDTANCNSSCNNITGFSTILQNCNHYSAACGSVVSSTDYTYNPAYSQYGSAYGSYGYTAGTGLLNSSYYYDGSQSQTSAVLNQDMRSPLAATRANSLASATSPTGSACTKSETSDIFLV